jgi:ABC-type branched-subunit amino acid transport system ATPase component
VTAHLEVRDLRKSFGGVRALRGAGFAVREGSITALIGPNGAGKSTAFQCISGVIEPDAGQVTLAGEDITGKQPEHITAAGLVRSFQIPRAIQLLSVLENMLLYAQHQPGESMLAAILGTGRAREHEATAQAMTILQRLGLAGHAAAPASALSGGQKKLLEIGRCLMAEPRMLLLDEPAAGVNPTLAGQIAEHLDTLKHEGMTILLVEHRMDMIARLSDHVVVMAEGQVLTEGSFETVADDPRVQSAYMGARAA